MTAAPMPFIAAGLLALAAAALAPLPILMSWAHAQTPIEDPGQRLEQERRRRSRDERLQQTTPAIALPGAKEAAVDVNADPDSIAEAEPAFPIERIEITGNTVLGDAETEAIVSRFRGKRLGVNRINLLLRTLTEAFIARGCITTRAYLGEQNLAAGVLKVTVIPGRIEALTYNGQAPPLGVQAALPLGVEETLKLQDLEQGIDQLNRLRANRAEAQILPGQTPGGSIVSIRNEPGGRFHYGLGMDNYGQAVTGQKRLRAGVDADNLLGLQDALALTYVGSLDTNALLFAGSVPLGYDTFSYTYSYSEFQNLVGDTALLFGASRAHGVAWNRLLSRSRDGKSGLDLSLSLRRAERSVNDIDLAPQKLSVARLGWNALRHLASGFWTIDLGYARGLDAFGASADAADLPREAAHARFAKFDFSASLTVQFSETFAYRGMLAGQWSRSGLFSSEQIFAGGAGTVRGFAEGALAGDRGAYTRHELLLANLPQPEILGQPVRIEPYAFLDGARVQLLAERDWNSIAGAGLGVRLAGRALSAEIACAKPVLRPDALADNRFRMHASVNASF